MTDTDDADGSPDAGRPETASKVGRVIAEYGLEGLGDTLEHEWTRDDGDRASLRDLADDFNKRVLESAMADAGVSVLEGEVENTYRLLEGDDVSRGMRTQAKNRLGRNGIDVESLRQDFVSHQAVHTYLTKYREAKQPESEASQLERDVATIGRLQSRTTAVVESILTQREKAGDITVGDFDVLVDVKVLCRDCDSQYDAASLLQSGGCDCDE